MSFFLIIIFSFLQAQARPNIPLQNGVEPPELLSDVGVLPKEFRTYQINQALFVDFAQKERSIFIPENSKIGFSPTANYKFPVGTVLLKHFKMEISKGVFQNIETRLLVRKEGEETQNWVGYTYKWEGADAHLVNATNSPEVNLTIEESALGGARQQNFKIPSRLECLQCHNSSVGFVRSFQTMQLNRGTQLEEFSKAGIFDQEIRDASVMEKFAAIDDESAPLEKRVRSYLSVNCSHCHNPSPAAMCNYTGLDFRFSEFNLDSLIESGNIVKGAKDQSEIFLRMDSVKPRYRMPYIGSALKDPLAVDVVGKWIEQL